MIMETNLLLPKDVYTVGEVYEFKVVKVYSTYCELIDEEDGIISYLQGTAMLKIFKGQIVKCRVTAVNEKRPKIELVDISNFENNESGLTENKLSDLLLRYDTKWNFKEFIKLILTDEKERSFENQCHKWIQSLLNKKIDLHQVRRDCSNILEFSEFLDMCDSIEERDLYQNRLTILIEQIGYYIKADELIANETEENANTFVDNLLAKLKSSGYVYHPSKNFNILSSLFLMHPSIMNEKISLFLDVINSRQINLWKKEPFNSAIVKMLELYIEQSEGKIDKTKDNKELITNNIKALSLQLLLLDNHINQLADRSLNISRLCLLSSYIDNVNPKQLLDIAFYYLFNSQASFIFYNQSDINNLLIPHFLNNHQSDFHIDTINSFSQNKIKLIISDEGVKLYSPGANNNSFEVFPKDLNLWMNIQVFLENKPEINLSNAKSTDLNLYFEAWKEIEFSLFNTEKKKTIPAVRNKKHHKIDEKVRVSFIKQDSSNLKKFYCQIEDEIGGEGYIFMEDIVPYNIQTSLRHFFAPDGSRYVFDAIILDEKDDMYHFSMIDVINEDIEDFYDYDEDIICSIGGEPNASGMSPAVTKEGVSVSIRNAGDFDDIKRNSIVSCRLKGAGYGTFQITCEMQEVVSSDFDLTSAFCFLMDEYSVARIPEKITDEEEDEMLESDKIIDETYVKEVIYLIDRMALIDKEYIKSYNYLGFARVLCMLIGWEAQANYYKGRMDIINLLHYFAINSTINDSQMEQLSTANEELFSNNPILRERFNQLQTISFLGKTEHNHQLFNIISEGHQLSELASMVLAYNIVKGGKMESAANDIHNRIKKILNLKGFETGLKLYADGKESSLVEFKSSLVYYSGSNSMQPNIEKQKYEILKVIDSFFNTNGGTLYLGVNDFGYGVGLESDLNNPEFNGNKDKFLRTIIDLISLKWGNGVATTYIEDISYDNSNTEKDVLILNIKAHPDGLPLDDTWYVRIGSTKRKLNGNEYLEFKNKNRAYEPDSVPVEVRLSNYMTQNDGQKKTIESEQTAHILKDDSISTSKIRKNILADYMDSDNYVEPIAFFKFVSGGKFKKMNEYDYDEDSLLTLTVLEHEKNGYLILGYENGHIVKVPIKELLDYGTGEYSRYNDDKLLFASIGLKDDAVLSILKENKTKPKNVLRVDSISKLYEEKLNSSGSLPYNEGLMKEILGFEIIPSDKKNLFKGVLDKAKSFVGYPNNSQTTQMCNYLHLFGINSI